jgi:hypothetical protein
MEALLDVAIRLLQQLTDQQHHRCCAIAADVVLRRRRPCDHDGSGVLYLHLAEENVAILGQFDLRVVVSESKSFTVSPSIRT